MAEQQLMIPIDYTINVNVSREDAGLPTPNSSNIALLTTDKTTIEGAYGAYITADDALKVVDGNSLTAKMITALFGPDSTFRENNGQLFIVPVEATKEVQQTIYEVTHTVEETISYQVKKTADETLGYVKEQGEKDAAVANEVQVYSDVECTEELAVSTGSDYTYTGVLGTKEDVTTAYTSVEGESGAFVAAGTQLYSDAQLTTPTVEASGSDYKYTGETQQISKTVPAFTSASDLVTLVTNLKESVPYWGVLIDTFDFDFDMTDFFTYVDTQSWLYLYGVIDYTDIDLSELKKTEGVYSGGDLQNTKQVIAAYASVGTSANWEGSNTAITMNLKSLSPISAPGKIDTTILGQLQAKGISAYAVTANESRVYSHSNGGGYWDDKIGGIALTLQLQYNMYNLAANTKTKYGYNEAGILAFRNAAAKAWQQFIDNGFLTKGMEWSGNTTFGDKEAFLRSIKENGYYQYNAPISSSTAQQRKSRRITIQGAGQSAGAIHFVTYNAILA